MSEREVMPTTQVPVGAISPYTLVCGDPGRARQIASCFDHSEQVAASREYHTYSGDVNGVRLSVASHGVGAPGAAVCFEELIRAGASTLIRVGSAGSYTDDLPPGSLIIATGAVRADGLTRQLVPDGFPAVGDTAVITALNRAATAKQVTFGSGLVVTLDAFYPGVMDLQHKTYRAAGVLGAEMEIAALYVISSLRGVRAGAIVALDGYAYSDMSDYDPHRDLVRKAIEDEIDIAISAMVSLATEQEKPLTPGPGKANDRG